MKTPAQKAADKISDLVIDGKLHTSEELLLLIQQAVNLFRRPPKVTKPSKRRCYHCKSVQLQGRCHNGMIGPGGGYQLYVCLKCGRTQ